jgi:vacuolar-type H+-ATPase catalytic subunit A/Vma1
MREFGRRLEKETIPGRFVSKLNDAETEAAETQVHVEIAFRQSYLKQEVFDELDDACDKILAQIVKMIDHADRWIIKPRDNGLSWLTIASQNESPTRSLAKTPTRRHAPTPQPPDTA